MKASGLFAGRGSQGNSWTWDFTRGGAEKQLRAGRRVRNVRTGDTSVVELVDGEITLVRMDDGSKVWVASKALEVVS